MTLTDTFQLHEGDGTITEDFEGLAANNERAKAEKDSAITVIVMNPPYSVGQKRANDNNKNLAYPAHPNAGWVLKPPVSSRQRAM